MTEPTAEQMRKLLENSMSDAPDPHPWSEIERRRSDAPEPGERPRRTALWVTCAASIVALIVGLIVFIDAREEDSVPADAPSTTVADDPTTPSSVPDTTTEVTSTDDDESEEGAAPEPEPSPATTPDEPAAGQPSELGMPQPGETQRTVIGDITWTLLEGDSSTQPTSVSAVIDGVFYGVEGGGRGTWRSPDGITWELTDLTPNGIVGVFEIDGETWARRSTIDGQGLGRWDGEMFAPVELPDALAPDIEGLRRTPTFSGDPVELDGRWVVPVATRLSVPWNELYPGTSPEWDAVTQTIRMVDWTSTTQSLPVAVLTTDRIDGDPGRIEFRDSDTGELVIAVEEPPGLDRDDFFRQLVVQGGLSYQEFLIREGETFEAVASPWPLADSVGIDRVGGELLAVVTFYGDGGSGAPTSVLWASTDGRDWEPRELPTPFGTRVDHVAIESDGSLALLTIVSSTGGAQRAETWSTVDGVEWQLVEEDGGFGGPRYTDVGWFRDDSFETGGISVSSDGLVWQEIPFDIRPPRGPGGGGSSVYGDTIFVSFYEEGGDRTMWVGEVNAG